MSKELDRSLEGQTVAKDMGSLNIEYVRINDNKNPELLFAVGEAQLQRYWLAILSHMSNFFLFSQESNLRAAFRSDFSLFSFILSALTVYTLTLLYPKDTCFKAGILAEQLDNHYSLPHFLPKSIIIALIFRICDIVNVQSSVHPFIP